MTKNEAIEKAKNLGCSCFYMNDLDNVIMEEDVIDLIIQIYDDFENRICKNCKYSGLYQMGYIACLHPYLDETIKKVVSDFGCNRFERK